MTPRFDVKLEISEHVDEYGRHYTIVENVMPESISLECPHCNVLSAMRFDSYTKRSGWKFDLISHCPNCKDSVFMEAEYIEAKYDQEIVNPEENTITLIDYQAPSERVISIYPKSKSTEIPEEIPENYRKDYAEAHAIRKISPKASAAMSRRILQTVLREEFKIKKKDLATEIGEFLQLKDVPSYISESVDAIRSVGNFAAHPSKNINTGEIVDVEPGEAEWLLETLDSLLDFTFVRPKRLQEMKRSLNKKLQTIGKPPMKQ